MTCQLVGKIVTDAMGRQLPIVEQFCEVHQIAALNNGSGLCPLGQIEQATAAALAQIAAATTPATTPATPPAT